MGLKEGAAVPLLGGAESPSNDLTQCGVAWAEVYLRTEWILIHPAVWQQQTSAENWGGGLSLIHI